MENVSTKLKKPAIFYNTEVSIRFWAAIVIGGFFALVAFGDGLISYAVSILALMAWIGSMNYNKWGKGTFFIGFIAWLVVLFFFGTAVSLLGME